MEYEEGPQPTPMKNVEFEEVCFRISVSLERYFSDERARCFVSVSARRRVQWLRRRLRRLFGLPRHFALLTRGHLLPPDEPLSLLAADDRVDVVPIQNETHTNNSLSTVSPSSILYHDERERKGTKRNRERSVSADSRTQIPSPPPTEVDRRSPVGEPAAVDEIDDDDSATQELHQMKRRALELLDSSAGAAPLDSRAGAAPLDSRAGAAPLDSRAGAAPLDSRAGAAPLDSRAGAAPRPRRRRVRRRRAAVAPATPRAAAEHTPAVVQNGADTARAARLVRPLEDDPVPPSMSAPLAELPEHD